MTNLPEKLILEHKEDETEEISTFLSGNTDSAVYKLDLRTKRYDFFSPCIKDLIGYSLQELNEFGFKKLVKEILFEKKERYKVESESSSERMLEEYTAKYIIETKSGETKWIEDNSFIELDAEGNRVYSVGVLRDVTLIHNFVDELSEEKNKLESFLNLSDVIFVVIDKAGVIQYINERGCRIAGYSKEEVIGEKFENFIPVELIDDMYTLFTHQLNPSLKIVDSVELPIVSKSGKLIMMDWHNARYFGSDNQVAGIISSGIDITQKKKDEQLKKTVEDILNAANSEKNLFEFFSYLHSAISRLMKTENFYIAYFDKKRKLLTFPYFVDEYDKDAPPKRMGRGLTEYILRKGESELIDKETDTKLVEQGEVDLMGTQAAIWLGVPLKIQDETIGVIVVQDYKEKSTYGLEEKRLLEFVSFPISRAIERRILEEEKGKLISELEHLNRSKDQLFSLISHDLRGPFNSLLGFSEILSTEYETLTTEEAKEYVKVIHYSAKNLFGMTNNLLSYSKFHLGRFEFKPDKMNLWERIQIIIELFAQNIKKKKITVHNNVSKDISIVADPDMFSSILNNVMGNAIKFSNSKGEIKISANLFNDPEDLLQKVIIEVEDNGVGISKENLEKIKNMKMFSTKGTDREYGSGLGLMLVNEFLKKHNGKIEFNSVVAQGTIVKLILPIEQELTPEVIKS